MRHWHVLTWNDEWVISGVKYTDYAKSIVNFVDLSFAVFEPKNLDKFDAIENLSDLAVNETDDYHIALKSPNLVFSWMNCDRDPCKEMGLSS